MNRKVAALVCMPLLMSVFAVAAVAQEADFAANRWVMHEITFESRADYADPFNEAELDVIFTGPGDITMVMPGFWDGGSTWRVRFAPTQVGLWTYESVCSNSGDTGLHGIVGAFECVPYTGDLEIYKRGFVKTLPGTRHFVYGDGTPFFYLGDTHWTMPKEPFDTVFKPIVEVRARQGFTVYQSEPITHPFSHGPGYNLRDGLDEADLAAFADLDRRFDTIAQAGLVHANAQLFWTIEPKEGGYSQEVLRQLSRYWVARFAAYPVLWTTAQEADKDFYGAYTPTDNPWIIVAAAVGEYDPYRHPLTAHQENTGSTRAGNSAFKELAAHSWFAAQWSPSLTGSPDFAVPKDYWESGGGKPAVNYEGRYDYLWTKHFGARAQGWISFLNGMFGYGYGAIDIWYYQSAYDMDTTSSDGVDTITPEDKATPWTQSLHFETAGQMGQMRAFFEGMNWWELEPRFGSWEWFIPVPFFTRTSVASRGNDAYAAYFYNPTRLTGLLRGLDQGPYEAEWFNPRSGETVPIGSVRPLLGMACIPCKPDKDDWVFYLYRAQEE